VAGRSCPLAPLLEARQARGRRSWRALLRLRRWPPWPAAEHRAVSCSARRRSKREPSPFASPVRPQDFHQPLDLSNLDGRGRRARLCRGGETLPPIRWWIVRRMQEVSDGQSSLTRSGRAGAAGRAMAGGVSRRFPPAQEGTACSPTSAGRRAPHRRASRAPNSAAPPGDASAATIA
jgi:hypothetical protein